VQGQRKSGSKAETGAAPQAAPQETPQEQLLRAASVGMSITQDASKDVGKFLTAAIKGLEKNLQTILQSNDGPLGDFMRTITQHMIEELTARANRAAGIAPGQTATNDTAKKAAAQPATPDGRASRKARRRPRVKRGSSP